MSFTCPNCLNAKSLKIIKAIDLPSDSRSDEITVQIVTCQVCHFRAAAVYEESRRGTLDKEVVQHTGYRVEERILQSLLDTIAKCPAPRDHRCRCATHRALSWIDPEGRWQGLDVGIEGTFPMILG